MYLIRALNITCDQGAPTRRNDASGNRISPDGLSRGDRPNGRASADDGARGDDPL